MLKLLMDKGYEGEELLSKYQEIKPKYVDLARAVSKAETEFAEGHITTHKDFLSHIENLKAEHGI